MMRSTRGPQEERPPDSIGRLLAILVGGRPALFGSWFFLSVVFSNFLLCFLPSYPMLIPLADHGGVMGIPGFVETPSGDQRLHTWPFREYRVDAPAGREEALELQLLIGDYFVLLRGAPDTHRIGFRLSVDPRISSAVIHYDGDHAEQVEPIASLAQVAGVSHRLAGAVDAGELHFYVDGQQVASFALPRDPGLWYLAAGIKPATVAELGVGSSLSAMERRDPWSLKKRFLVLLTGLLLLAFPFLPGRINPALAWSGALVLTVLALPLHGGSIYLVVSLFLLSIAGVGGLGYLWGAAFFALWRRRSARPFLKRAVPLSLVLLSFVVACRLIWPRAVPPPRMQARTAARPPQGGGAGRILVFGASNVVGDGLARREEERFSSLLVPPATMLGWSGASILDMLKAEEEAHLRPGDVVILYLTFNDAMNPTPIPHGGPLGVLRGMNFIGLMRAFYDSGKWMNDHFERNGAEYEAAVSTFVSAAQRAGARVILVGEPVADFIIPAEAGHGVARFHDLEERLARTNGAIYVDFPRTLLERRDDFLFVDMVHLNRHGHALLAERINAALADLERR